MEHHGRHFGFYSLLVCGEAAHTKSEKVSSFSDSGSNSFKLSEGIVSNVVEWLDES